MKDYILKEGTQYRFNGEGKLLCVENGDFVSYDDVLKREILSYGGDYLVLCDGKKLFFIYGKFLTV